MSAKKSKEQQEQERWYVSRAYLKLAEATDYSCIFKYAESVNSAYESIEFCVKALCKLLNVEYPYEHFIDEYTVAKLSEKIRERWPNKREELLSALPIILSYSDRLRGIAKYGVEDKQKKVLPVSPGRIFCQDYSDKVLKDAQRLAALLSQIERSFRWDVGRPIKLGILNGYVCDSAMEKPCSEYVWSFQRGKFWNDYFSGLKRNEQEKYQIVPIKANEVTEEFPIVLNPFGETYPEYSLDNKEIYNQIKLFIENGGVFVNTAGFPFFYAWDVKKGEKDPISEERLFLPKSFDIREGTLTIKELQGVLSFTGTLFYKNFGASTTYDTKTHIGSHEVETFQTDESKSQFGDLRISKVHEFRALRKETRNCLPILTANCYEFGEIYPIAAIKSGRGFLLVAGMSMITEEEATLFAKAVDRFCDWMTSKYSYTKVS
jgi:HEPN domain-containing protein